MCVCVNQLKSLYTAKYHVYKEKQFLQPFIHISNSTHTYSIYTKKNLEINLPPRQSSRHPFPSNKYTLLSLAILYSFLYRWRYISQTPIRDTWELNRSPYTHTHTHRFNHHFIHFYIFFVCIYINFWEKNNIEDWFRSTTKLHLCVRRPLSARGQQNDYIFVQQNLTQKTNTEWEMCCSYSNQFDTHHYIYE